ncbi:MAG: MogA/MoaB family molybdenum cofactor biosynthesis protein [Dehalococcoidales bacterium]|nr:MogA/MoaB family molybdenum cofactor biosynthesis protein [Dehalococcoidales bacterium]
MSYQEHKHVSPQNLKCAVITTSDSRTEANDESGSYLKEQLISAGHTVTHYAILKNDVAAIRETIQCLIEHRDVQVIITSGGTGLSKKDVTVNTIRGLLEKELEGFGEIFRALSYQEIGAGAIMSRALAGVAKTKIIICIPGSLGAVKLAVDKIILPEIGHLVREATR